jgi:hypothetical protein
MFPAHGALLQLAIESPFSIRNQASGARSAGTVALYLQNIPLFE